MRWISWLWYEVYPGVHVWGLLLTVYIIVRIGFTIKEMIWLKNLKHDYEAERRYEILARRYPNLVRFHRWTQERRKQHTDEY